MALVGWWMLDRLSAGACCSCFMHLLGGLLAVLSS
jgi:hypothetical protein